MRKRSRVILFSTIFFILYTVSVSGCGRDIDMDVGTDTPKVATKEEQKTDTLPNDNNVLPKDNNTPDGFKDSNTEEAVNKRDNTPVVLLPEATGAQVFETDEACVDVSNLSEGYVMIRYKGTASKVRMLLVTPLGTTYNYRLTTDGKYSVFPMSDGDGVYKIGIYENVIDDKYAELFSQEVNVVMTDPNKVFLYPNQYVNFNADCEAVAKGAEIVAKADTDLDAVREIFDFVTKNVTYDYDKAATVQSGYLPVVDETLATGKGICFDYSALMATMLRTQRIPTRLEIGYAGTEYHAWISVYIKEEGWIEDYIVFDGKEWVLMDPTLVSSAKAATVKATMKKADTYYDLMYKY